MSGGILRLVFDSLPAKFYTPDCVPKDKDKDNKDKDKDSKDKDKDSKDKDKDKDDKAAKKEKEKWTTVKLKAWDDLINLIIRPRRFPRAAAAGCC